MLYHVNLNYMCMYCCLGLVSSSDDESDNSIAVEATRLPQESKGDSIVAKIANEIDEDDDDFDFYS